MLFITHRLREVIDICDRATILRDEARRHGVPQEGGEAKIVDFMLGPEAAQAEAEAMRSTDSEREPTAVVPEEETVLAVEDLRIGGVQGVSFALRRGEILGLAALEGQGQDDLFKALAGEWRPDGEPSGSATPRCGTPSLGCDSRLVLVPADRLLALLPQRLISENVAAPRYAAPTRWGPINMRDERRRVRSAVEALQIDLRAGRQARRLSGGNQQGDHRALARDRLRRAALPRPHPRHRRGHETTDLCALRELSGDGAAILFFSLSSASFRSSATAC